MTRDAVLKWIKQGRLPALRTAGGHYRLREQDVRRLAGALGTRRSGLAWPQTAPAGIAPLRCWEFVSSGDAPPSQCVRCLAFLAGASYCFQLRERVSGVSLPCCGPAACTECPYYRRVHGLPGRLLLLGSAAVLSSDLRKNKQWQILRARDVYRAGQLVMQYFPAVAVVDAGTGRQGRQFIEQVLADPHAIRTRVVYVGAGRRPKGFSSGAERAAWPRVSITIGPLRREVLESLMPPVPAPGFTSQVPQGE